MATAYLLASVLTLIVALVHGQEAFPEQELQVKTDKLVEVAEDILEEEQNFYTELLLLGSGTSRAECIQKKKCKNKGGTCQKKGNACTGKSVKGCAKGCSCCLPEEIICKRSKKCKRANGVCISRSECNGKIIDKGCRKPKTCKKTHVCCIQDDSTTCRGGSGCPNTVSCPNSNFAYNHVCETCDMDVLDFVISRRGQPPTTPGDHTVFSGPISYTSIFPNNFTDPDSCGLSFKEGEACMSSYVTTTRCRVNSSGYWAEEGDGLETGCILWGACSGQSLLSNGDFIEGSYCCED